MTLNGEQDTQNSGVVTIPNYKNQKMRGRAYPRISAVLQPMFNAQRYKLMLLHIVECACAIIIDMLRPEGKLLRGNIYL